MEKDGLDPFPSKTSNGDVDEEFLLLKPERSSIKLIQKATVIRRKETEKRKKSQGQTRFPRPFGNARRGSKRANLKKDGGRKGYSASMNGSKKPVTSSSSHNHMARKKGDVGPPQSDDSDEEDDNNLDEIYADAVEESLYTPQILFSPLLSGGIEGRSQGDDDDIVTVFSPVISPQALKKKAEGPTPSNVIGLGLFKRNYQKHRKKFTRDKIPHLYLLVTKEKDGSLSNRIGYTEDLANSVLSLTGTFKSHSSGPSSAHSNKDSSEFWLVLMCPNHGKTAVKKIKEQWKKLSRGLPNRMDMGLRLARENLFFPFLSPDILNGSVESMKHIHEIYKNQIEVQETVKEIRRLAANRDPSISLVIS